ncbi:acyl-CoA dehydrogenase family protein [Pseudonocardia halophobica]|uniref:acyl-CoA dehydrogenase family protein n=1 Tax=Pseudonocardia halophobica TaxID=29401 RepID=UPI003D8FE928
MRNDDDGGSVLPDPTDVLGGSLDPLGEPADLADFRLAVRAVVAEAAPAGRIAELDERAEFDAELHARLAGAGVLAAGAGDRHGGIGDVRHQMAAVEEVAAGPTSMAVALVVHYLVLDLLTSHGTPAQQERWLGPLMSGRATAAFALTEPGAGTDVAGGMVTTAKRTDGGWTLDGHKTWIAGAARADVHVVLARSAPVGGAGVDGITTFLVPADTPGVRTSPFGAVGLRAAHPCDLELDAVAVPDDAVVGTVDAGFRELMRSLNRERLNAASGAAGAARGALAHTLAYARDREAFSRSLGSFQAVQHRLVDGVVALEAARGLLRRAGEVAAGGGRADLLSSMAKLACSEAAVRITSDGLETLGAAGLSTGRPLQRWFRDVRLWVIAPLANDMVRNYLGERHLGLPRSF